MMRLGSVSRLNVTPHNGLWIRAIRLKYWKTRLASDQTRTNPSRFVPALPTMPGPRVLYLGENHQVVAFEVGAMFGSPTTPVMGHQASWVFMSFASSFTRWLTFASPPRSSFSARPTRK